MRYKVITMNEIGKDKLQNEDTIHADPERGIFIIADGMSRPGQGKTASVQAVSFMRTELEALHYSLQAHDISSEEALKLLEEVTLACNDVAVAGNTRVLGLYDQHAELARHLERMWQGLELSVEPGVDAELPIEGVPGDPAYDMALEFYRRLHETAIESARHTLRSAVTKPLQAATELCKEIIRSAPSETAEEFRGMGTTLDACLIHDDTAYTSHVGNGRIYQITRGRMSKVTEEHVPYPEDIHERSPLERTMIERGQGLSNYVGKPDGMFTNITRRAFMPGDMIVMLTDGITHTVSEEELLFLLTLDLDEARTRIKSLVEAPQTMAMAYATMKQVRQGKLYGYQEAQEHLGMKDDASMIAVKKVE